MANNFRGYFFLPHTRTIDFWFCFNLSYGGRGLTCAQNIMFGGCVLFLNQQLFKLYFSSCSSFDFGEVVSDILIDIAIDNSVS